MALPNSAWLLPLAESVSDGSPIDWDAADARATVDEQSIIRQLRILANLATVHRSLPGDAARTQLPSMARLDPTAPTIGDWGHLTLIEKLGEGSAGEVYRAWDNQLECEVALKLLRTDESCVDSRSSPIAREGRLLARVRHPHVITVHGVAVHDGRVGLWMELIRGETLEQLILKRGVLSGPEAVLIGIDLCRALAAIHAAGLIHRDVKAQNVMREDGGRIVLMDLGTALEIVPGGRRVLADLAGTPLYLAPELFEGTPASERTDLYSLGVLLYHLVTGSFPVRATAIDELTEKHAKGTGVRLRDARADLPTSFVRVIDRAIAKDPDRRYESAGALEADLGAGIDETNAAMAADVSRSARRTRLIGWTGAGLLAATLTAMLTLLAVGWPTLRGQSAATGAPGTIRSIAVLPLANLSGDPTQEYFAEGITDELIATLGRLGSINVISRTSVMAFKRSNQSLPDIARQLHVDAVLEGSVLVTPVDRREESTDQKRVRINARLIYGRTDTQLWNRTFDHVLADVVALQSEVAHAVAEEVHLQWSSGQQPGVADGGRRNAAAQELYLRARSYMDNSASERLLEARRSLESAVQLDPAFARAHASLALCYVWLQLLGVIPQPEARTLATAAAKRGLQLDPDLPDAYGALADVEFFYNWNRTEAGSLYRRALALNPSYTFARRDYAWYLAAIGQLDEALRQARLAQQADPLSADASNAVGMMLYFGRKPEEAIPELRRALALAPGAAQYHNGLAHAYAAKRAFPEAVAEIQQAVRLSGGAPAYIAESARTLAESGHLDEARDILARLQRIAAAPETRVAPEYFAYVHAALGENDRAFRFLEQSLRERSPEVLWAKVDPRLDRLRQDSRFAALLRRIEAQ